MARLIDAEEFEAYCIERDPKYSEAEWQAYLDGVQRVLEAIDAAPTMKNMCGVRIVTRW